MIGVSLLASRDESVCDLAGARASLAQSQQLDAGRARTAVKAVTRPARLRPASEEDGRYRPRRHGIVEHGVVRVRLHLPVPLDYQERFRYILVDEFQVSGRVPWVRRGARSSTSY